MRIMPGTRPGKWPVALLILFLVLFVLVQLLVMSGQRGGDTFRDNLLLTVPVFAAGISGILAFVTGMVGVFRNGERAVLVFLSTAIGLVVILFVVGEFAFPH